MLARLRPRLSYANVVATLALFLALCGGSYAALKLPKNSVGSKQLRKNSVTSTKVKAGSRLTSDFKGSQRKGLVGPAGPRGATGPAGPVTGTLPSKATLRGVYELDFVAATADETEGGSFNFPLSLASAPKVEVVGVGGSSTANCPGAVAKPEAKPGFLCVYKDSEDNASGGIAICDADCAPDPSAMQVGAVLYLVSIAAGRTYSDGTWAVTAP
jgi:hypothetical protein